MSIMRNNNGVLMILADRKTKNPERPRDRQAMAVLQEVYCQINPKRSYGGVSIFTKENMVQLGKLYYNAWGVMPTSNRCQRIYSAPDYKTVISVFGSIPAYHDAIQKELP